MLNVEVAASEVNRIKRTSLINYSYTAKLCDVKAHRKVEIMWMDGKLTVYTCLAEWVCWQWQANSFNMGHDYSRSIILVLKLQRYIPMIKDDILRGKAPGGHKIKKFKKV